MAAIITNQLRILNSKNFISGVSSSTNSYYMFVGLPNSSEYDVNWNSSPIAPKDNFDEENFYWDNMVALKRINSEDVRQVIRRITWESGTTYDMYRHDISRTSTSKPSDSTNLYSSNFYVVNEDYRVYICLYNGISPENPNGRPSLDEPTFTDLEPKSAGTSGDGYIWKYLYTITPTEINKFVSEQYIPVPKNWKTSAENSAIRNNAESSGQIKFVTITDRGSSLGNENTVYTNIPIKGDGNGATVTIIINTDSKVESITISNGGSGYTYGSVDIEAGNMPTGTIRPKFDVIIPPKGGHGADIYRELGAFRTMIYSRLENDSTNPDFTVGNSIARIGIVYNPEKYDSNEILTDSVVSALGALKLKGPSGNQTLYKNVSFASNSKIHQTIGTGVTVSGKVISYDPNTGVLKYWQDRNLVGFNTDGTRNTSPEYGFEMKSFTADPTGSGSLQIVGGSSILFIDTDFGTISNPGTSTVINSRTYNLGQSFVKGIADPEVKKYSGDIIYVDNRASITRSPNQKEDIKVILQF